MGLQIVTSFLQGDLAISIDLKYLSKILNAHTSESNNSTSKIFFPCRYTCIRVQRCKQKDVQ